MDSVENRSYRPISALNFDNRAIAQLPIDPEKENYTRQVRGACFSLVEPTPVVNPKVVAYSKDVMEGLLGIDPREFETDQFAQYFSGNEILPGARPAAHCYCGHQFGYFSGQLGDGATMYLGEIVNDRNERWEIQFKGAGKTPYSRTADGRKVLRSSIREFLCSEANHFLGVPTTRAGTVVTSDSYVIRDIFYSGNPIQERCSIVLRVAPTFLRFGSFEIFKTRDPETGRSGPSLGLADEILPKMIEYVITTFYPDIDREYTGRSLQDRTLALYQEVVLRTARLVAEWQTVGFCHGVLNTDNMSIIGVTIDYGPFGFMDAYDPNFVCNGSDSGGRYSYKNQPEICQWNLKKLAEAFAPVLPLDRSLPVLDQLYNTEFNRHYHQKMLKKLGLSLDLQDEDRDLIKSLFKTMEETGSDFTNTFRSLSGVEIPPIELEKIQDEFYEQELQFLLTQTAPVEVLKQKSAPSMPPGQLQTLLAVAKQDPRVLAMFGIDPEQLIRELALVERQQSLSKISPSEKAQKDRKIWSQWLSKYVQRLQKEARIQLDSSSTSSSSSEKIQEKQITLDDIRKKRIALMNSNNPKFVLRNYIAQKAIDLAEKGDFQHVREVLELLRDPYGEGERFERYNYHHLPPDWALDLCVT